MFAVLLSVPLALLANARLTDAAEHARQRLQAQARDLAGVSLSYESMSIRLFGAVAVTDLSVSIPALGAEVQLDSVVLRYRLGQLIRGGGTAAIRFVRARSGMLRVSGDAEPIVPETIPVLPRTAIRDLGIRVDIPGLSLSADLRRGRITPRDTDPSVALQLAELRIGSDSSTMPVSVERLSVDGAVAADTSFEADTDLRNARFNEVTLRRHRTLLAYDGERITATSVDTGLALAYDLWFAGPESGYGGTVGFSEVVPAQVVQVSDGADPLIVDALWAVWSGSLVLVGGPDGLEASGRLDAQGRLSLLGNEQVVITSSYRVAENVLYVDQLLLRQDQARVGYRGSVDLVSLLPRGRLSVYTEISGQAASATAVLEPDGDRVYVGSTGLLLAGTDMGRLDGWIRPGEVTAAEIQLDLPDVPEPGQASESEKAGAKEGATEGDGSADAQADPAAERPAAVSGPELALRGFLSGGDAPRVDLGVEVSELVVAQIPLARLLPWLPQQDVLDSLVFTGGARITGLAGAPTIRNIELAVRDRTNPEARVAASGVAEPGSLRIEDIEGLYSGVSFAGSFRLDRADQGNRSAELQAVINGQAYRLSGTIGASGFQLESPQGLAVRGGRAGPAYSLNLSAREFPIPADSGPITLNLEAGAAFGGGSWSAEVSELAVLGWVPPTASAAPVSIGLTADIGPDGADIADLVISDQFSRLVGNAGLRLAEGTARLGLELAAEDGELLRGSAELVGGDLSATLALEGTPTERILGPRVQGQLSGTLVAQGPVSSPRVELVVRNAPVEVDGDPITVRGRLVLNRRQLALQDLFIRVVNTDYRNGSLSADLDSGTVSGAVTVVQRNEPGAEDLDISVIGTIAGGSAAQTTAEALRRVITEPVSATVALDGVQGFPSLGTLWVFEVQRLPERTTVRGGPGNSVSGELLPDGSFTVTGGEPLPARFELSGTFQDGELQATISDLLVNLAPATEASASEGFAFTAGQLSGGLFVTGPIYDPSIAGTVDIRGVVVESNLLPEPAFLEDTFGVFRDSDLSIGATEMSVGDGIATVTAQAFISRYQLERYGADLVMNRETPLPVAADFGPVALDGSVWGEVFVGFELNQTSISGDITLEQTAVLLGDIEVLPADDGSATIIDVAVRTGRGVEFYWPSRTIPVFRAFSTIGDSLSLQGNTATGAFAVQGGVGIRGGEIAYVDQNFLIRRGSLQLNETETDFDPRVSVEADIRDIYLGSPVTITLIATDSPLSQLSPRFISDPQLSEVEIAGILGGDILAAVTAGDTADGTGNATELLGFGADLLGQFGVLSGLESSVRDTLGLDVFSIRTSLFENLVIGALSERTGTAPAPSADLGRFLDNTTLFVGRFLGEDVFLQGLVQLRSSGSDTVTQGFGLGGVQTAVELSMEWQTPILDLEWIFAPSDPASLFVRDHRFAFSWQFAY